MLTIERGEYVDALGGALGDRSQPAPAFSVCEARMHAWIGLPDGLEHVD